MPLTSRGNHRDNFSKKRLLRSNDAKAQNWERGEKGGSSRTKAAWGNEAEEVRRRPDEDVRETRVSSALLIKKLRKKPRAGKNLSCYERSASAFAEEVRPDRNGWAHSQLRLEERGAKQEEGKGNKRIPSRKTPKRTSWGRTVLKNLRKVPA